MKKKAIQDEIDALTLKNCYQSIFLDERFNELRATLNVLDNEITYIAKPVLETWSTADIN